MKFYQSGPYVPLSFAKGNSVYTAKQLIEKFKDGVELEIEDEHGNDVTNEFLITSAFGNTVPIEYVAKIIDQEELESIIYAGGYDNWNIRQRMGAKK